MKTTTIAVGRAFGSRSTKQPSGHSPRNAEGKGDEMARKKKRQVLKQKGIHVDVLLEVHGLILEAQRLAVKAEYMLEEISQYVSEDLEEASSRLKDAGDMVRQRILAKGKPTK